MGSLTDGIEKGGLAAITKQMGPISSACQLWFVRETDLTGGIFYFKELPNGGGLQDWNLQAKLHAGSSHKKQCCHLRLTYVNHTGKLEARISMLQSWNGFPHSSRKPRIPLRRPSTISAHNNLFYLVNWYKCWSYLKITFTETLGPETGKSNKAP